MTSSNNSRVRTELADIRDKYSYCAETGVFRWKVRPGKVSVAVGDVAGSLCSGYWVLRYQGRNVPAHRVAWLIMTGAWPNGIIDHRNLDRLDNRWVNLRLATKSQNAANARGRASLSKGVSFNARTGRYSAAITYQYKRRHIGTFVTEEQASEAYADTAARLFGEFARAG